MNIFDNDEIVATGYDGQEIRIAYKNVKDLQEQLGASVVNIGNMSMLGGRKEHIKIFTCDENEFEIPRSPDNDTAILNFLLRGYRH